MKIAQRLGIGFGILLCLFGAYSLFALERISALADLADELHNDPHAIGLLVLRAEQQVQIVSVSLEHLSPAGDSAHAAAAAAVLVDHSRQVERIFASIEGRRNDPASASIEGGRAGGPETLIDARHALAQWRDGVSTAATFVRDGRMPEARATIERDITGATRELLGALKKLEEEAEVRAAELSAHAHVTREASTGATLSLLVLMIVTAFALTLWLTVCVHDPIDRAEAAAKAADEREREARNELEHLRHGAAELASAVYRLSDREGHASRAAMEQLVCRMSSIGGAVSRCAAGVADLDESPRALLRIANAVEELADHANVLAVNSAIEAARAGDDGRGFQAVSEEIRRLATATNHVARQVTMAAETLDLTLGAAAANMQMGTSGIDDATEAVEFAGNAIDRLSRGMAKAARRLNRMSSNTLAEDQVRKPHSEPSPPEELINEVAPAPGILIHEAPGSFSSGDGAVHFGETHLSPEASSHGSRLNEPPHRE